MLKLFIGRTICNLRIAIVLRLLEIDKVKSIEVNDLTGDGEVFIEVDNSNAKYPRVLSDVLWELRPAMSKSIWIGYKSGNCHHYICGRR